MAFLSFVFYLFSYFLRSIVRTTELHVPLLVKQCGHLRKHLFLKCFTTKRGQYTCEEIDVKDDPGVETDLERRHASSKYILAGLQFTEGVKMFMYDPDKRSFLPSNISCQCGLIRSLAYVKNREIVLLADLHSTRLFVLFLKKNICSEANIKISCSAMELHHQRQRVYIASATGTNILFFSVAPDGNSMEFMFRVKGYRRVNGMAIDEHGALIYVSTKYAIISFTEHGTQKNKRPFQSETVGHMHLDYTGSTLYFVKDMKLFELNTLTNGSRRLHNCSEFILHPRSMEWFMGKLFLTFIFDRQFIIMENEICKSHKPPVYKVLGLYFAS